MGLMFLFLILSGAFLAEGLPSTEEKQTSEILKRLEAKIEQQDAVNNELHSKNEALRKDMSELVERMETKANRTEVEEALMIIRDTELLSATGDKAVRDLPYIMMCAYQNLWTATGIIAYDSLTLDYSNCDKPGETLLKQCSSPHQVEAVHRWISPAEHLRLRQEDSTLSRSLDKLI